MSNHDQSLQAASIHRQNGNFNEAARLYRSIIRQDPNNSDALHSLGIIEANAGNFSEAKPLLERSLSTAPGNIQLMENYAAILFRAGDYEPALEKCWQGLQLSPDSTALNYVAAASLFKLNRLHEALMQLDRLVANHSNHTQAIVLRSSVLARMQQYDAAIAGLDRILAITPGLAEAHMQKGTYYGLLERYDDALACYDRALALKPDFADALLGRANALLQLNQCEQALLAYDQVLMLKRDFAEAYVGRGNTLSELRRYDEALDTYDKGLVLKPDLANAWLGRGNLLLTLNRFDEAGKAFDNALSRHSELAEAWLGRGNLLLKLDRRNEALSAFNKALSIKPTLAGAWLGCGKLFYLHKYYDKALAAWEKALELKPDISTLGLPLRAKMHICDWEEFDAGCARVISSMMNGVPADPFAFVAIPSTSEEQLRCAQLWTSIHYPVAEAPIWKGERYDHDRIRVAYLSGEFHQHATSYLMAGVFEHHDRSRFQVIGISVGPDDESELRRRVQASFERFIDARDQSDEQVAKLVRELEIDLLIDLNGFTGGARVGVYTKRPAPIQLNYLGYPGTMGTPHFDYIVADRVLIPDESRQYYAEKVVYLPDTYQANDTKRSFSDNLVMREELGLPPAGFVFCCFNNNYKITPHTFNSWARILSAVKGSVLWLYEDNAKAADNLKKEASARGIESERLIFAKRLSLPEHLARHRAADLFLDTLPYNAHTTASDALWAGLPVLTCVGDTFAGRVGASLLNAIRLPELITTSSEAYERLAIELASDATKLKTIKEKLARNRLSTPLFDTKMFTRHIEAAYTEMWKRHKAGLAPDHIDVVGL
jgi:predicted O-linked N-acetylglucosamine transferase (SPINDLY family)